MWGSKNGSVLRLSGAKLDCLRGDIQCQARRVRRDNKFERQLWSGIGVEDCVIVSDLNRFDDVVQSRDCIWLPEC